MIRLQNRSLLLALISLLCFSFTKQRNSVYAQKKYPVNRYLDSLIRNARLVEISEILSEPELSSENGNTVYTFSLAETGNIKNYPFAAGVSYPFLMSTTKVRYIVNKNDKAKTGWLKKGNKLIFFAKAIYTNETTISSDCWDIVGFVKPNKKNLHYIKHTYREGKSYVAESVYHTGKKPRRDRNTVGRKEQYWIFYENGNMKRESIYRNKLTFVQVKAGKGKKRVKLIRLKRKTKMNYYYESGIAKERIITTHKYEMKTFNRTVSYDTTRFDTTGKVIYKNHITLKFDSKNSF